MRDDARTPVPPRPHPTRHHPLRFIADFLGAHLGLTARDREETVASMLAATRRTPAGYWLQLLTAMGIATLGVVLDSTAVVIGAMLVAPLMTPIVRLGMGLAIGSPLLVLRSAARVAASVVVVPLSAAGITLLLPTHEITAEITSRASPTVLDLAIAACCAVAGVYAATRPSSDRSSTAAGTAIGLALVPPLCVVGFGLGTGSTSIAGGAALLFVANFSAIILLSVLGFSALGFASVPVATLEHAHTEASEASGLTARVARRLSALFSSRAGVAARILMPIALVVIVYVPLRRALAQVTWELSVRSAVKSALGSLPGETVHSSIRVDGHEVTVRVVTIEQEKEAAALRQRLLDAIEAAAPGTPATVEIDSVADSRALARAEAALRERRPAAPVASAVVTPGSELAVVRAGVSRVLADWPAEQAGRLSAWRLLPLDGDVDAGDAGGGGDAGRAGFAVEVVHVGADLGATAKSVLARSLGRSLGAPVELRDVALAPDPISAELADSDAWLIRVTRAMAEARLLVPADAPLFACIDTPDAPRAAAVVRAIRASPVFAAPRAHIEGGAHAWSMRWSGSPCTSATDAGADAAAAMDAAADAAH